MSNSKKGEKNEKGKKNEKGGKGGKGKKKGTKWCGLTDGLTIKPDPYELFGDDYIPKRDGLHNECLNDDDGIDWQMSPFSKERYELDAIQRAQKRGVKGKAELEKLMIMFGLAEPPKSKDGPCGEDKSKGPTPGGVACADGAGTSGGGAGCSGGGTVGWGGGWGCSPAGAGGWKGIWACGGGRFRCTQNYMYQPYGPNVTPVLGCERARRYNYLGPSAMACYEYSTSNRIPAVPCEMLEPGLGYNYGNCPYIPMGPTPSAPL